MYVTNWNLLLPLELRQQLHEILAPANLTNRPLYAGIGAELRLIDPQGEGDEPRLLYRNEGAGLSPESLSHLNIASLFASVGLGEAIGQAVKLTAGYHGLLGQANPAEVFKWDGAEFHPARPFKGDGGNALSYQTGAKMEALRPLQEAILRDPNRNYAVALLMRDDRSEPLNWLSALVTPPRLSPSVSHPERALASALNDGHLRTLIVALREVVLELDELLELPSGALLPRQVLSADATGESDPLARGIRKLISEYTHFRGLRVRHGLTLVTTTTSLLNTAVLGVLRRPGDPPVQLTPEQADEIVADLGEPFNLDILERRNPEDVDFLKRQLLAGSVKRLLTLPLERTRQEAESVSNDLRTAMAEVAALSERQTLLQAALHRLQEQTTTPEKADEVAASLQRAGKITSLTVEGDLITATTSMVYIKDDRSGAWHRVGEFTITIDTRSLHIKYHNRTDPLRHVAYGTHPHIDNDGRACVGNFSLITAQLVEAQDWLGLVEMCVVFLQNANTDDPAGRNLHKWPFVEDPVSVGLPPYEGEVKPFQESRTRTYAVLHANELYVDPYGDTNWLFYDDPEGVDDRDDAGPVERAMFDLPTWDGDSIDVTLEWDYGREDYLLDGEWDRDGMNIHTGSRYDDEGYDWQGYDDNGWSRDREHFDTCDIYDRDGYDIDGYDRYGYDRDGYDIDGYDRYGWDRDGDPRPLDDDDEEEELSVANHQVH